MLCIVVAWAVVEFLEEATPNSLDERNTKNITLIFLVANVFIAGYFGFICGLIASLISVMVINYFYIEPLHSFFIEQIPEQLNIALFIITAFVTAIFTANLRSKAHQLAERENRTRILYDLNRHVSAETDYRKAIERIQTETTKAMKHEITILLPEPMNPKQLAAFREPFSADNMALASKVWENSNKANNGHHTALIMGTSDTNIGVLFICHPETDADQAWRDMLDLLANQSALLIERLNLNKAMQDSLVTAEREKLRSMLLSSVSHDLKTPLASIIGGLSVYHSIGHRLTEEHKQTLTQTALDEAQRLDSFISNILDITKLESGAITFSKEWLPAEKTVKTVIKRLKARLRHHLIEVHAPSQQIEIEADPVMTGQILQNLLDNAVKYTKRGTKIDVTIVPHDNSASIIVRDHGNGIPADKIDTVFDKYARLHREDTQVAGTGLGLAIAKTVMEAQGGTITAANYSLPDSADNGTGAVFTLTFNTFRAVQEAA